MVGLRPSFKATGREIGRHPLPVRIVCGYLCRVVTILVPPVCTIEACTPTPTRALTALEEEEEEEESRLKCSVAVNSPVCIQSAWGEEGS